MGDRDVEGPSGPVDRKNRIREYKDTPRPMGVYRVLNTTSGRSLVGSSRDLPAALNRHRAELRLNGHRHRQLQADWNALGADAFSFEILDTLAPPKERPDDDPSDDLRMLEALWREKLEAGGGTTY